MAKETFYMAKKTFFDKWTSIPLIEFKVVKEIHTPNFIKIESLLMLPQGYLCFPICYPFKFRCLLHTEVRMQHSKVVNVI